MLWILFFAAAAALTYTLTTLNRHRHRVHYRDQRAWHRATLHVTAPALIASVSTAAWFTWNAMTIAATGINLDQDLPPAQAPTWLLINVAAAACSAALTFQRDLNPDQWDRARA